MTPKINVQWNTRAGLPAIIKRMPAGHLCGYVGVPESHPAFGLDYEELYRDTDVHGGLTFSEFGDGTSFPAGFKWFGFDCAHWGDASSPRSKGPWGGTYRTARFVAREVRRLAKQLREYEQLPIF